ncbi:Transporter [Pseudomonas amygdali pv. morsprunorum]|nr:Transporter [Pseudomonas amygdali pv. morsprunorum]PPS33004.1 transporter [Pseudomonas amygdali pv. morsprunorum]
MTVLIRNVAKPLLLTFSLLGLSAQALAETKVDDAWVRATVPGQSATGAFMRITSDTDSKLVDVASPVAKTVQVKEGDQVPLTLTVEDAKGVKESIQVTAVAKSLTSDEHSGHGDHSGH